MHFIKDDDLKPGRNDPCPCGSGKKYKKCCGLSVSQSQPKLDHIKINRAVAYKGAIGRRREAFCLNYTAFKKAAIIELENELRQEVASSGKTISCSRGCAYCCAVYVFATLQECESIVYYLYHHDEILEHFIQSYEVWRDRIRRIERSFQKITKIQEKVIFGQASDEERQIFDAELTLYANQNLSCPFLIDGSCSIYEVRPFVCAGVVSSSPAEWCAPSHPCHNQSMLCKAELETSNDMPYFVPPKSKISFACLPELVYQLLVYGYGLLSSVQGLEHFKHEAANDPEVRKALQGMGYFEPPGIQTEHGIKNPK